MSRDNVLTTHPVRRDQRVDLLFAHTLRDHGLGQRHAAHYVRRAQRHPARGRQHVGLDHGSFRPKTIAPRWQRLHDHLARHHRYPRRPLLRQLARSSSAGLDKRRVSFLLHAQLRCKLGSCAVGNAVGDLPK